MTRPNKPIESFGAEVFQALIEGATREIKLDLTFRQASYFRHRANLLRAEMRRQNHAKYPLVSQVTLRIEWPDDTETIKSSRNVRFPKNRSAPCKLVLSPADSEFNAALRAAGVHIKPIADILAPDTTEAKPIAPPSDEDDVLANYLKE